MGEPSPSANPYPERVTADPAAPSRPLSGGLVALIAVATGAVVANLYYAQPVLHQVAHDFHQGSGPASLVITCTQLGYAAGLLLVVPLGDLMARRTLVTRIFLVVALSLVGCALAPNLWLFGLASVAVGAASVAGQVMIPFAADLAPEARRGRVVARIMTGLLLGILLARTVSGLVAQLAGWRAVYWFSAVLMLLFAAVLWRALPSEAPRPHSPYRRLVGSSLALLVHEPLLPPPGLARRLRASAPSSVLWTTIAFLLSEARPTTTSTPSPASSAWSAPAGSWLRNLAGRLADADRATASTVGAGILLTGSFALLAAGKTSLAALIAGIVVLDIGTQGMQITNQAIIYALRPDARSRINSAYMVCYFIGGATGSVTAGLVYAAGGWRWTCALGAGFGLLTMAMAAFDRARPARLSRTSASLASSAADRTPATS